MVFSWDSTRAMDNIIWNYYSNIILVPDDDALSYYKFSVK